MASNDEGALLTPTQRAFLRGETDFEWDDSRGRTLRTRMRKRIERGIWDFSLLGDPDRFDERDAELVRDSLLEDQSFVPDLAELVAFVYRLDPDAFKPIIETGTHRGVERVTPEYTVGEIQLPIQKRGPLLDRIRRRMDNDKPLTDRQVRILLEFSDLSPEEIQDYVRSHSSSDERRAYRHRFR